MREWASKTNCKKEWGGSPEQHRAQRGSAESESDLDLDGKAC